MTTVEVPHSSRSAVLTVSGVIEETSDARSLVFEIPAELKDKFDYKPGQFLTLRIPSDQTGSVARCYSLASSPFTDDAPKVTVKRTVDGYGSNFIYEFSLEGKLLKKWGGPTKDAANLSNAHGISLDTADPRGPLVWVPSRSQNQIKAFTLDGKHVDSLDLPGAFAGQLFFRGDKIYTAVCWSKDAKGKQLPQSGFLLVLDRATKKVLSAPGRTCPAGSPRPAGTPAPRPAPAGA